MARLQIFGGDGIMFHQLPDLVNRYMMPPEPIVIHYSINPAQVPPERPSAWDIEVKMEDTSLKNRIMVTVQSSKDSMSDLTKLDDEVTSTSLGSILSLMTLITDRPAGAIAT